MAIHSPNTGIVDYAEVTRSYADDFKQVGGRVFTRSEVRKRHVLAAIVEVL